MCVYLVFGGIDRGADDDLTKAREQAAQLVGELDVHGNYLPLHRDAVASRKINRICHLKDEQMRFAVPPCLASPKAKPTQFP